MKPKIYFLIVSFLFVAGTNTQAQTGNDTLQVKKTQTLMQLQQSMQQLQQQINALQQENQTDVVIPEFEVPPFGIVYPNGGEIWQMGKTYTVRWSPGTHKGLVNVVLMCDRKGTESGYVFHSEGNLQIPNRGYSHFIVPEDLYKREDILFDSFRIRITSEGHTLDDSDGTFTIEKAPMIQIVNPNGGEIWETGQTVTILWESERVNSPIKIALNADLGPEGAFMLPITESTENTGTFSYRIPTDIMVEGSGFSVQVQAVDGSAQDASDNTFSLFPGAPHTPVEFKDRNLETIIREQINKPGSAIIYQDDLNTIVSLKASGMQIKKLDGIQHLISLKELHLWNNDIENIEPLSDLPKLQVLHIEDNAISDLRPLSELKRLKKLRIDKNQVQNLSPLATITSLIELDISKNRIGSLNALSGLVHLQQLFAVSNEIRDISPLSSLENLEVLSLTRNRIQDITPLARLTNLRQLLMNDNQVSDIQPLAGLKEMVAFAMTRNNVQNIDALTGMKNLFYLSLASNRITDINALSTLKELQAVYLANNEIKDISALGQLPKLEIIYLHQNQISNIGSLLRNTGIGSGDLLNLRQNPIDCTYNYSYIHLLKRRGVALEIDCD